MPSQIPFQFPNDDLDFDDLAITAANRATVAAIRQVERWPFPVFCLVGPPGSGLTTLLKAWAKERDAWFVDIQSEQTIPQLNLEASARDLALDRADLLRDDPTLLLAISAAKRNQTALLLTAQSAPSQWPLVSPDLLSRLKSAPIQQLPAPDEAMLRARLKRGFSSAYLHLTQNVEDYLVSRMGLDYSLIEGAIEKLAGAAADRPVTIPVAREVLGLSELSDEES